MEAQGALNTSCATPRADAGSDLCCPVADLRCYRPFDSILVAYEAIKYSRNLLEGGGITWTLDGVVLWVDPEAVEHVGVCHVVLELCQGRELGT